MKRQIRNFHIKATTRGPVVMNSVCGCVGFYIQRDAGGQDDIWCSTSTGVGVAVCRRRLRVCSVRSRRIYRIIGNSAAAAVVVGARGTGGIALWIH